MQIYFSDFFEVSAISLEKYGAFNISLINDLPLFVDPFLLFNSKKTEYRQLHDHITNYVKYLREKSEDPNISLGLLQAWYLFPEVKQNWLGFSLVGNQGAGLRDDFAKALHKNLHAIFSGFGEEKITKGSHLEKLCLIKEGVGRDKISDFTTNLIKEFLLNYTQEFTVKNIPENLRRKVSVDKVRFNYQTQTWESDIFELPFYLGDYVILTPKDMLTKDDLWINKDDLYNDYHSIPTAIPNEQLRAQIDNYFRFLLPRKYKDADVKSAISQVIIKYPEVLDYYIRQKENTGNQALSVSAIKVQEAEQQYIKQIKTLSDELRTQTSFYSVEGKTYEEALSRIHFLKDVIENQDGYRLFYVNGNPIKREQDLQILYRLTWHATDADVNREVNNGRGPVDYKVSRGRHDATLVEFKLAKNTQLEKNLQNQVEIYKKANNTSKAIKVILYFTHQELLRARKILKTLKIETDPDIILIDARRDNKVSASRA